MRGAEIPCPVQLLVVGVNRNDSFRPHQPGSGDCGIAHPAAADHRDGVVTGHPAGVDRRPDSGHDAAAQQSGHGGIRGGIDLCALTLVHQGLVDERPDAQRGRQLGAVGQCHPLLGVERVEAQVRPAPLACAALTAHCAPVQDHEIAGLHVCDARPDGLDGARGLVAEQERVFVVDAAVAVGQVGMADAASDDVDDDLARSRVGDDHIHHLDRFAFIA